MLVLLYDVVNKGSGQNSFISCHHTHNPLTFFKRFPPQLDKVIVKVKIRV